MNYLTMCSPTLHQNASDNDVPMSDIARIENNIYSIPLFHNEFYENVDTAVRPSCDITQPRCICNETMRVNEPLPCDNIRYSTETWRRNFRDTAGNTACRDSGNESLHMNSADLHQSHPETIQTNQGCGDELGLKKSNKESRSPIRKLFICVFIGIFIGIILSTVVWLTLDKFKHNKFNCSVKSSLTLNKIFYNLSEIENLETNKKDNSSEQAVVPKDDTSTPSIIDPMTQFENGFNVVKSTFAETSPTIPTTHALFHTISTINSVSSEGSFGTSTLSTKSSDSTEVHTKGSRLSTTDDLATQSIPTSRQLTSTTNSKGSSTSSLPQISLTSDFTQEPDSSSTSDISAVPHSPNAEGLSQTTAETVIASGGHVFYRWGRIDCPQYSELLYEGFAAGGHYIHSGGASNNLCLPSKPTWGNFNDAIEPDRNLIHVTEYESTDSAFNTIIGKSLHDHNVPCAVCQATGRYSFLMLPGRTDCLHGWYQEYTGYLMGGSFEHPHGKSVICVDRDAQSVPGSETNENGNLLYFVEFRGTNTDHYINGRELPCVVCTR